MGVTYNIGYRGPDISALQKKLQDQGLYSGPITGLYDLATQTAYNTFTGSKKTTVKPTEQKVAATVKPTEQKVEATVTQPPVTTPPPATTDAPLTYDPTKPFDQQYDPAKDTLLQATLREKNRQIQNAMNRRGIYGSTIMQENLSSADASLLDTYTQLAKQKYDQSVSDRQSAMETAYANAKKRGYYNNEEAALWGVKPGTKISSGTTTTTTTTPKTTKLTDGTVLDSDGNPVWSTLQTNKRKVFAQDFDSNPQESMTWLVNSSGLPLTMIFDIIDNMVPVKVNGKTPLEWYEYILGGGEPVLNDPNSAGYVDPDVAAAKQEARKKEAQRRNASKMDAPYVKGREIWFDASGNQYPYPVNPDGTRR